MFVQVCDHVFGDCAKQEEKKEFYRSLSEAFTIPWVDRYNLLFS